jgi:hypothetical protein
MKTIFKGVINGKEFTDVKEYNKEMTRLLNAGANVNAHTSTESVHETCTCGNCNCNCKNGECTCNKNLDLCPGFTENSDLDFVNVLDALTGTTEDTNVMEEINTYLKKNYPTLVKYIETLPEDKAQAYMEDIQVVLDEIESSEDKSRDAKHKVQAEIKKQKEKLALLENSLQVIDKFEDFYVALENKLDDQLSKFEDGADNLEKALNEVANSDEISKETLEDLGNLSVDGIFEDMTVADLLKKFADFGDMFKTKY